VPLKDTEYFQERLSPRPRSLGQKRKKNKAKEKKTEKKKKKKLKLWDGRMHLLGLYS
jgi:hypothetical protein